MSEALNVLVVEDEPMLAESIEQMLHYMGCKQVWSCADAACALKTFARKPVDLVFMDINIKGVVDGIQCAKKMTRQKSVSIVFATSFCDETVLEEAIDVNTLNYLVKPFGQKEIEITLALARIAKRQRDSTGKKVLPEEIVFGPYTIDIPGRRLYSKEGDIALSNMEFHLLVTLAKNADNVVSTADLIREVWQNRSVSSSTLRETLTRVRKKVPGITIKAVHGMGYRLIY